MSNFLNKYKSVYDVFLDNWSYQSHYVLYLEALMRQQTLLPNYIKEMIFAYISGLNGCQYCKNIHAEISKKLLRDANDEQPLLDIENAGIEEKYKPILKLAHKVNVDIFELIQNGSILISILYIIGTFALTVGAFFLGMSLLRVA